jgi:hypothetical protein
MAYGLLGNSTTSSEKYRKKLGQRKPAEDNIIKQSNWTSASSAHLRLFLARRFLGRTKEQKNGAGIAHHTVDAVLPFLICFEA